VKNWVKGLERESLKGRPAQIVPDRTVPESDAAMLGMRQVTPKWTGSAEIIPASLKVIENL
jgi:hypothetical protein